MGNRLKKTSMESIAKYLGISRNAVSLALNNKKGVSDELRAKIIEAAEILNYADFGKKRDQRIRKNLVIIIPYYLYDDVYFYPEIYWAMENQAQAAGYNTRKIVITRDMESALVFPGELKDIEISGIIIVGILDVEYIKKLISAQHSLSPNCSFNRGGLNYPVITVDNDYSELQNISSVVTANIEGAFAMTEYVIQSGHKEIGFVGPVEMTNSFFERWQGYNNAMKKYNLHVDKEYCIINSTPTKKFYTQVKELLPYIKKLKKLPTAWICANDITAMVLIKTLFHLGIKVPDDISVAGFDDIESAYFFIPSITTVKVDRKELGNHAVARIIDTIENKKTIKLKIHIYTKLVIRDSVKCFQAGG